MVGDGMVNDCCTERLHFPLNVVVKITSIMLLLTTYCHNEIIEYYSQTTQKIVYEIARYSITILGRSTVSDWMFQAM